MNRIISFNAWLPELGFMVKDIAVGHGQIGMPFIDEPEDEFYDFLKSKGLISQDDDKLPEWIYDSGEDWCAVMGDDHFTLLQFTGLKDKNGVDIYEGDVYTTEASKGGLYMVYFENGCWYGGKDLNSGCPLAIGNRSNENGDTSWMEVIGNIYENPELLKP